MVSWSQLCYLVIMHGCTDIPHLHCMPQLALRTLVTPSYLAYYTPDALPVARQTALKHCRQHENYEV